MRYINIGSVGYIKLAVIMVAVFFPATQWLQFDVGPPTLVTGLITKGRGDGKRKQWVTRFRLSFSNDTQVWYYYKDASHLDPKVILNLKITIDPRVTFNPKITLNSKVIHDPKG